jgi:general secretion pathway protein G
MTPAGVLRPACTRGFTLTEMLVVISIISVLAALVLGALAAARRTAREKAVQATILVLESALERYANDFQDYPPSDGDPERGGRLLHQCLMTEKKDGPYLRGGDVKTCDPERCGEVSFSDEWSHSIRYLHHRDYQNQEPNKHTFRLMSAGPDGVFEDGAAASDDIVNWDKSKVKR